MEHPEKASLVSSSGSGNDEDKGIDGTKKASNSKEETELSQEKVDAAHQLVNMSREKLSPQEKAYFSKEIAHYSKIIVNAKARMYAGETSNQGSSHNRSEKNAVILELAKQPKYCCKNCGKPCHSPQELGGHTAACNRRYYSD